MNLSEAIAIVECLADGIDPVSSEPLPRDHGACPRGALTGQLLAAQGKKNKKWVDDESLVALQ
jgi:hypothetical protein